MLLTDGCPNTVEDLRVHESGILDVAATERMDLGSKLSLAEEEVSEDVLDFLLDNGRANDPKAATRRETGVSDVAVTRQMKRWHAVHTIALVYRDALHNQLNTRYGRQSDDYRRLAAQARAQTLRFGVGVVTNPVPRADPPQVTGVAAAGAAEAIYYIRISWVDAAGREGAPSKITAFEAAAGVVASITALNPPAAATGFKVYAGLTPETLALQTAVAVPVGSPFTLPATGVATGPAPGDGQAPDTYVTGARVIPRG